MQSSDNIMMVLPINFFQPLSEEAELCDISGTICDWDIARNKVKRNHQSRRIESYTNQTYLNEHTCELEPNGYAMSPKSYTQSTNQLSEKTSDNTSKYVTCYCTEEQLFEDIKTRKP